MFLRIDPQISHDIVTHSRPTRIFSRAKDLLTHWGRVRHICINKIAIIGSHNGLSPGRRQAIIWTNAGILLIWLLGTNFSEISIKIDTFSLKKIHLKMSSGKWRPSCLGLNVLTHLPLGKVVVISQTTFSNAYLWIKSCIILIQISLEFVPKWLIDNKSALVQVMAWSRTGDKPLPKPMLT